MRFQPLSIALAILFFCLTLFILRKIDFETENSQSSISSIEGRPIYEYLIGGVTRTDLHRVVKQREHHLPQAFWDALKFMDQLILEEKPKEALNLRNRLRSVSDLIEQVIGRSGFLSLVSSHADVIDGENNTIILDADLLRTQRRVWATEGLEAFWDDDRSLGFSINQKFPRLAAHDMQSSEVAYFLRYYCEKISESKGNVDASSLGNLDQLLEWCQSHPSPVVQAERAFLLEEMAASNLKNTSEEMSKEILSMAIGALKDQAPQRIELLDLILSVGSWSLNDAKNERFYACDYLIVLNDRIDGRLYRKAFSQLEELGKFEMSQKWLKKNLNENSHLYGASLHLKALEIQKSYGTAKQIFAAFEKALSVVQLSEERADLLVDLSSYERELSKDPKDVQRDYFKRALQRLQEAAALDPEHLAARVNLANMSLRLKNYRFARRWLENVDSRRASNTLAAMTHFIWGKIYINENKKDKARYHYELAKECEPNLPGLVLLKNDLK